eukprot:219025_1
MSMCISIYLSGQISTIKIVNNGLFLIIVIIIIAIIILMVYFPTNVYSRIFLKTSVSIRRDKKFSINDINEEVLYTQQASAICLNAIIMTTPPTPINISLDTIQTVHSLADINTLTTLNINQSLQIGFDQWYMDVLFIFPDYFINNRIALTYKELPPNGYALSLPSLPQKRRCQILFDYKRKQLLAYCDNKFDIYTLQFNDKLTNENEWKWNSLPNEMKWSRTRPSFGICGNNLNKLFIVGDIQTHHAKYAEIYEFNTQKWIQLASQVPYIAHNGILYYDNCNNLMYYCGGQQRNCGYYNLYKHKWFEMKYKTQYIYNKNNSTMWNSLHNNNKQILWIANANNCEFYDTRMSQSNNKNKWQIFPNINDNNTHLKIQNYLNVKFDNTNCDYTLLSRI